MWFILRDRFSGSFAGFAVEHYGVEVVGVTISREQIKLGKELHKDRYTEKNDRDGLPCRHSMPNQLYFEVNAHGATYRIRIDHGKNAVVTSQGVRIGG